jgi:hypothetical protein
MSRLDYGSSPPRSRLVGFLRSRFSRAHAWVAGLLWLGFTALTLYILLESLDNATDKRGTVAATTAATVLGPMTGAISRDFQGCCLRFSLYLLPWCGGALAAALAAQLLVPRRGLWTEFLRLSAWAVGLTAWFGGGIVSFGHALS